MAKNNIKNLFGSNTRIKLLELFFSHPDQSFFVREITRLIDEQINSVRRELANLLDMNVIKKADKDNKVFYGVDQKFRNYVAFAMIFDDKFDHASLSRSTVRELEKEAKIIPQVSDDKLNWQKLVAKSDDSLKIVVLAGKLVPDSDSEIDMLVVGDDTTGALSIWAKKAEKAFGSDLIFSILPYDEFYYRMSIRDRFVTDVLDGPYVIIKDLPGIIKEYK